MTQPMQIQPANLNCSEPGFQEGIICTLQMGYMILEQHQQKLERRVQFLKIPIGT